MVVLPVCVPENCGKDFRFNLRKPSPNWEKGRKPRNVRLVPAFTIQALQKNTKVIPFPKHDIYEPRPLRPTLFKKAYQRGELPVSIEFSKDGQRLSWRVPIEKLDFHHYMPIFFEGLAEPEYPYNYIVEQGIDDMIKKGAHKVLPVVPQLIIPIKKAIETRRESVIIHAMKCICLIVKGCDKVGIALVPYYRQLLPVLNLFRCKNRNLGAGIDTPCSNIGDMIQETLQVLERYGGPDAFINIKYMVPTYESCMH